MSGLFAFGGILKVTDDPASAEGFRALGLSDEIRYFVGLAEIAGAIGLLIPILSGLTALCLTALMTGATTITAFSDPALIAFPAVTLVIVALIAMGRRYQVGRLAAFVRGVKS
ncbi:DoxX family protein [Salininema proteolyticum]|uniref:DoxX family protein n=1 Tax=Salininema proteolyticum TaxID=1607685 RepID=A0ABV8U038_9ACTN